MTAHHVPELVSADLLQLTNSLGRPERDLVILAEGNTSALLPDGRLMVKASGSSMQTATAEDFVALEVDSLTRFLTSASATQRDLTAALDAGVVDGRHRRGSIESLLHAAVQAVAPAAFVGHTHPTAVVGLLASVHAEKAWADWVYSDEAVVIGHPLYIPYASPGIDLGRVFFDLLSRRFGETGELPQLVLLGNHGIVAIAPTAAGVEGISAMAVKGALVRTVAYSVGGVAPLSSDSMEKFFARPDIAERRGDIKYGQL